MASPPAPTSEHTDKPIRYIIYPVDAFKLDSISALLASFPNANVVEHVSVSGWGMMYWEAQLTSDQLQEVKSHQQVEEVEDPSTDADYNPDH
ncbi:hypothetical protein DL98DRAFT_597069 [Cadophora sp. DSE1049]|nr:hypothetical protein DL98DRAFT_597069 [Cadophora sp. DSE1049]